MLSKLGNSPFLSCDCITNCYGTVFSIVRLRCADQATNDFGIKRGHMEVIDNS